MRGCARNCHVKVTLKGKLSTTVDADRDHLQDSTVQVSITSTYGGARIAPYTKHTQASSHQPTHGYNVVISALPPQEVSPFLSYPGP
jgi:hypothetical protein